MDKYEHVISLGYFCSVSSELERVGLRDCSSPFDWVLSDFESVLELINNNFNDFMSLDYIQQYSNNPSYYLNKKYNIRFYHDFDKYKECKNQIQNIDLKYKRRIKQFYKNIQEPTLFIRYIQNQNEYNYIESNFNQIITNLRKYNSKNNIIFVANQNIECSNIKIFKINTDKIVVTTTFLEENKELKYYLLSGIYDEQKRVSNYELYKSKMFKRKLFKLPKYIKKVIFKTFFKVKIHDALYNPLL